MAANFPVKGADGTTYYAQIVSGAGTDASPYVFGYSVTVSNFRATGNTYVNLGTSAGAAIKSAAGNVFALSCINLNAAVQYLQFFDATAVGTTPDHVFAIQPGQTFVLTQDYFGDAGLAFATGISFGFSTTALTYTAGTATDVILEVRYA